FAVPSAVAAEAAAPVVSQGVSDAIAENSALAEAVAAVPPQDEVSGQATAMAPATAVDATGVAVAELAVSSTADAGDLSATTAATAPQDDMTGQAATTASAGAAEAAPMDAEQQDTELEYGSMVLLSKLEQLVIRLSDNTVQKSMPLVIEALVELTNHLAEFSDQLPVVATQKVSLAALLDRDVENYAQLRSQYVQENRLVLGAAEAGFGQDPSAFHQLSNDILRVVNIYLSASVKAFHTPRISEQWKTLYTGFFVNLSKAVRSAQDTQQAQQGGGEHHG
ncbi:MAG: hypothetical protein OEU26_14410, partial [Candidatus Tectomicrobia bacterium]|nr:hypothetical protein [Candidatus Tectomicrobia bacterium]